MVSVVGMGGLGKTMLAASLVQKEEVRARFPQGVAFITLGQRPSIESVQRTVLVQLTGQDLPDGLDAELRLARMIEACRGARCLLVIDDCWTAEGERLLNCVHGESGGRVLLTTRIPGLLQGRRRSAEVMLGELDEPDALRLVAVVEDHADRVGLEFLSRRQQRSGSHAVVAAATPTHESSGQVKSHSRIDKCSKPQVRSRGVVERWRTSVR